MGAFYQKVIDEHMNEERKKKGGDYKEDIVDVLISGEENRLLWRTTKGSVSMCHLFFLLVYTICSNWLLE